MSNKVEAFFERIQADSEDEKERSSSVESYQFSTATEGMANKPAAVADE